MTIDVNDNRDDSVSVVIPCYNTGPYLRETLNSVLAQTVEPLEVLVVDDGSTDDSAAIAESFGGPVRVIRQQNCGESVARNRGVNEACGEWVAFLDADDLWRPTKLAAQLEAVTLKPNAVCVHTNFRYFGVEERVRQIPEECLTDSPSAAKLINQALINTSTALVRRSTNVRFPEWTQRAEDMIYFAELAFQGRFVYVDEVLAGYRMHETQQSRTSNPSWLDHYQSRFRWIEENREALGDRDYHSARAVLLDKMFRRAKQARRRRDWNVFKDLRGFLATQPEYRNHWLIRSRVYPSFVYGWKDTFRSFRRAT